MELQPSKKLVKCENCGNEVEEWTLDRFGECNACRAHEKATDMGVGDLNVK